MKYSTMNTAATLSALFFIVNQFSGAQAQDVEPIGDRNLRGKPRPVMHTFYNRHNDPNQKAAEVEDHKKILQIWSETWRTMGFEPKILTLEDAKKHPDYEEYNKLLDDIPLEGYSGHTGEYNRLCYLRWLAMATDHVGGGFFSDFDVVPLTPAKPTDLETGRAQFTVYDNGFVPDLMSGSQQEWDRMAKEIIATGPTHKDEPLHSDMFALMEVQKDGHCKCKNYHESLAAQVVLDGDKITGAKCREYKKYRAVHFSHNAINRSVLKPGEGVHNRGTIIQEWWELYIKKCGSEL